jgi:hypothetical protein
MTSLDPPLSPERVHLHDPFSSQDHLRRAAMSLGQRIVGLLGERQPLRGSEAPLFGMRRAN